MLSASRAWFGVRVFGHNRVFVLSGGLARWRASNLPLETTIRFPVPSEFTPVFQRHLVATLDDLSNKSSNTVLVDCRSPGEYTGKSSSPTPRCLAAVTCPR
jgi:thiosulfate/3-mercaptopyruvate sulfurtransferase